MSLILHVSQNLTKLSISLFAGATTYCSLVEHPARLSCGTNLAATQFVPSFRRAAIMQGALASIASIGSAVAYYYDRNNKWLVTGLIMFGILPYTFACMMPVNRRLLDPKVDRDSNETKGLLESWGYRHWVRTVSSLVALIVCLHTK